MRNKQLIITLTTAIITALVTRKIVRFADNKKLERQMRELDERLEAGLGRAVRLRQNLHLVELRRLQEG